MTLYKIVGNCSVYHGDNRDVLKTLLDNSIDSVVTDPPYALVSIVKQFGKPGSAPAKGNDAYMRASAGFMGKQWDTGEVAFSEEFWAEVLRVLKPGGHVAAFGASRGYHRMACAIEDAGFEIRDSLAWIYATGFPKSQNVAKFIDQHLGAERAKIRVDASEVRNPKATGGGRDGMEGATRPWIEAALERGYHEKDSDDPVTDEASAYQGYGTALKPAFEPIVLARKPLSEKTVAANVLRWGTGALNIDGCRVAAPGEVISNHGESGGHEATSFSLGARVAMQTAGQALGRWPANVVHDGSDEVVGAFPNTASGNLNAGHKRGDTNTAWSGGGGVVTGNYGGDSGSAARFFYSAKASKVDRAGSKHPTVKPISLMQWLARLITPPGGTVLDAFAGSGTTGAACEREGFRCVLVEREAEYVQDIVRRLSAIKDHSEKNRVDNDQPQFELDI